MANSAKSPAPHDYGTPTLPRPTGGGQFSTAFPPTALEAVIRAKRGVPGPASYDLALGPPGGLVGRVQMARTPNALERAIEAGRGRPGPGAYTIGSQSAAAAQGRLVPGVTRWPKVTRRPDPPKQRQQPWQPATSPLGHAAAAAAAKPTGPRGGPQGGAKSTPAPKAKGGALAPKEDSDEASYGDGDFEA